MPNYYDLYREALDRPKTSGVGWKYADDDSMLASVAKGFVEAGATGLNPAMVYAGAKVKGIGYLELAKMDGMELNDLMFDGIDAQEIANPLPGDSYDS